MQAALSVAISSVLRKRPVPGPESSSDMLDGIVNASDRLVSSKNGVRTRTAFGI